MFLRVNYHYHYHLLSRCPAFNVDSNKTCSTLKVPNNMQAYNLAVENLIPSSLQNSKTPKASRTDFKQPLLQPFNKHTVLFERGRHFYILVWETLTGFPECMVQCCTVSQVTVHFASDGKGVLLTQGLGQTFQDTLTKQSVFAVQWKEGDSGLLVGQEL